MITGKNYIGNQTSAQGDKTFKTFNPLLNIENQWELTEATATEVEAASNLATEAYKTYSKTSGAQKAMFLRAIAEEIEALGDETFKGISVRKWITKWTCQKENEEEL